MRVTSKLLVGLLSLAIIAAAAVLYLRQEPASSRFYIDNDLPDDVWQIPIIAPYKLVTADCCREWNFQYNVNFSADSINYEQGFIVFHDSFKHQYGFYSTVKKKLYQSNSFSQFVNFSDSVGISRTLYCAEAVHKCWRETRQLPWAKEIFFQDYSPSISE